MVLMGHWRAKKSHNPIAGELVDGALIFVDHIYQDFETAIHDLMYLLRIEHFRGRGVIGHIGEKALLPVCARLQWNCG